MKTPRLSELKRLNSSLRSGRRRIYERILSVTIVQWQRLNPSSPALRYFRAKDWASLYRYADSLVVQQYSTAALHFAANQLAALIRKYPWEPSEIQTSPRETAVASFNASEHRCKWMNRWSAAAYRRNIDRIDPSLSKMRSFIRYVLGSRPMLDRIYDQCDFTGGASIGVHGNATNLARKLLAPRWSVTPTALPYLSAALCHNFHFASKFAKGNGMVQSLHVSEQDMKEQVDLVSYNKIAFVPKTAKTFRSIAVEPLGNGYIQKGVDLEMRKRLKRVGIDLSNQSLNSRLAREGSADCSEDSFSTIDLSSASDSISIGIVKLLLPPEWFNFLNRIRSPSYLDDSGVERRYEKFCSMGNGFCFPLETLIFAAACSAVTAGKPGVDFAVYGDDIVVRRKTFDGVVALLSRLGFKTNAKKTFASGPFRESCGGNWYLGEDVTPFTLDYEIDSLGSVFKTVNLARRNARTSAFLSRVVSFLIGLIPNRFLFFRPYKGPADTAIDFPDVGFTPNWRYHKEWQCPVWYELTSRPKVDKVPAHLHGWVVMAAALRGNPSVRMFTIRRQVEARVRLVARSGDVTPPEHPITVIV